MAKKDDAEEATFDPTAKRIRRLRDDGQVPRSQDFTGALTLLVMLAYLILSRDFFFERMWAAFHDTPIFAPIPFWDRALMSVTMLGQITMQLTLPVVILALMTAILATILDVQGFVFSLKPLSPNFGKLNPMSGLKNLFTLKNFLELIKSMFKLVILFSCIYFVVRRYLNDVFWSPTCGIGCILYVALVMLAWVVGIGAALLIVAAGVDLLVSRWLFKHDNKMTLTEMKREMKEDYGDPHIRSARKAERQKMAQGAGLTGPNAANLFLTGNGAAIGIAYKPQVSGVPIVAAKGQGKTSQDYLTLARGKKVVIIDDPELVATLLRTGRVGEPIPRDTFTQVARALVQAGFTG